eukprot:CAMPEP_0176482916 /NCGR_PEP_ID=MMETSP0200_2-20121128/3639_1 /TAXON_ID=947934 /ORGANISM="Chaetoceros sp., Strain GSL56" /LENGTH=386 /DNA_ID=CAMNT_0017879281 /DNA_START=226 /DNA_END=1386 /DNA_ORIENTATION=+
MFSSSTRALYEEPPQGVIQVFQQLFQLLRMHWRPLLSLSALQFGMLFVTGIVLFLVTLVVAGTYITSVAALMQPGTYSTIGRHLIDHSVGISGASRLLQSYYEYKDDYYTGGGDTNYTGDGNPDTAVFLTATFIVTILLIAVLWVVAFSLVISIFAGSFSHVLAEIYAGGIPCPTRSFAKGMERKWAVYCYQLFISLIITGAVALFVALPSALEITHPSVADMVIMIISILIFIVLIVLLGVFMTASIPSIVVENKSPIQGFKRSYQLCKNFVGFIFCSQICFQIVLVIVSILINMILDDLPAFFGLIGHLVVNLALGTIGPVLQFVLYMSMRIRSENVTQETLAAEIGLDLLIAEAVNLHDSSLVSDGSKNDSSAYQKVTNAEVV